VLLRRLEEDLEFLIWFRWDLGVKCRDRGSEDQFSDKLGQASPECYPRAAFGGQFRVAFLQLGKELTRRRLFSELLAPSFGGWSSRRQEGVEVGVDRWRQEEPANRRGNNV
jgi:hypothetical protein